MADAAQEGFDGREIDGDDLRRNLAVSLSVDLLSGRRIGSIDQAKPGPSILIKPVRHVLDAVLVLYLKVLAMRGGDRFGGHIAHVMSVHEYRHG